MTAGAQGHPGWVDNHPTSLKFLAASQVCLNPYIFCKPMISSKATHEVPPTTSSANNSGQGVPVTITTVASPIIFMDDDMAEPPFADNFTSELPSVQYATKIELETKPTLLNINPDIVLPQCYSEYLLETAVKNYPSRVDTQFVSLFRNSKQCKICTANLRSTDVTVQCIRFLLNHKLCHLDIRDCENLTSRVWQEINDKGTDLQFLAASKNSLPDDKKKCVLLLPKLRELILNNIENTCSYFTMLLSNLQNLKHLNLSECQKLDNLDAIRNLRLISLYLYNSTYEEEAIHTICSITTLKCLDISRCKSKPFHYEKGEPMLQHIIESLPELEYLDISGTNLTGPRCTQIVFGEMGEKIGKCDIPALKSRIQNPLGVLGLCHTVDEACKWLNIPALKILGDANEEQILDTVSTLMPHKEQLTGALNELFHQFRYNIVNNIERAMRLIFEAMTLYHYDDRVQISGSASLFYIMRSESTRENQVVCAAARQQMVVLIINAMERFPDNILMRNGCLTISQLRVPQQVLFEYKRLVALLLKLIRQRGTPEVSGNERPMAEFVCRISIYLLNSLACQVEGIHKKIVGDLGAVETMLSLICDKLVNKVHDDILEIAWSVMWNVTDETPSNCQRFLDGQGMEYFTNCLQNFSQHEDLLRNMMGLLGNVAEVQSLRPRLLTPSLISTFTKLLKSESGGIEVSYNAAGVLSHIASDGPDAWCIDEPSRESVLFALTEAIQKWDLNVRRNINYRSFEPILRLLALKHTPTCQHWAAWALCNLTRVYPEKYCSLVVNEGGVEILKSVVTTPGVPDHIAQLASTVLKHCEVYKADNSLDRLYHPLPDDLNE